MELTVERGPRLRPRPPQKQAAGPGRSAGGADRLHLTRPCSGSTYKVEGHPGSSQRTDFRPAHPRRRDQAVHAARGDAVASAGKTLGRAVRAGPPSSTSTPRASEPSARRRPNAALGGPTWAACRSRTSTSPSVPTTASKRRGHPHGGRALVGPQRSRTCSTSGNFGAKSIEEVKQKLIDMGSLAQGLAARVRTRAAAVGGPTATTDEKLRGDRAGTDVAPRHG